jgi:hypothetical protein
MPMPVALAFLTKVGFYGLLAKASFSGGMSVWMCSNVENITQFTNFTKNTFSTENMGLSIEHIKSRIGEAALTTGYECGDRCADILEISKMYNTEVREQLQVSCDSSAHTLALDTIIGKKSSCDYITSADGYNNIMDKIAYGAIDYRPINTGTGTFKNEVAVVKKTEIKDNLGMNALAERIMGNSGEDIQKYFSDKFNKIYDTTTNARRHVGWLMQGKTKTLEIIRDIITSFINNLRLFLEKDFLHFKSKIQKKYEDYELCADYVSQTITSLIGMLSLAHGI